MTINLQELYDKGELKPGDDGYFYCGMLYENEKEALNCGHETESYISTIQIEIEV